MGLVRGRNCRFEYIFGHSLVSQHVISTSFCFVTHDAVRVVVLNGILKLVFRVFVAFMLGYHKLAIIQISRGTRSVSAKLALLSPSSHQPDPPTPLPSSRAMIKTASITTGCQNDSDKTYLGAFTSRPGRHRRTSIPKKKRARPSFTLIWATDHQHCVKCEPDAGVPPSHPPCDG